ncbi:MAG: hypothetical protein ABIT76_12375 [Chthoniobacterales bacterium]
MRSLKVGVPCPKQWDELTGGASRRFCDHCQKDVHNLSLASPKETERLAREVEAAARVCVAYFQTPTGAIQHRASRWRRWVAGVQSIFAVLLPMGAASVQAEAPATGGEHRGVRLNADGEIVMGKVAPPPTPTPTPPMIRGEAMASPTPEMILGISVEVPASTPTPKP